MSTDANNVFTEFLGDYFAECDEHLAAARHSLLSLDSTASETQIVAAIDDLLGGFHSLKGLSAMVGFEEIAQLSHSMEEYLRELRTIQAIPDPSGVEALMGGVNAIEHVLSARRSGETPPDTSAALDNLNRIASRGRWQALTEPLGETAPASALHREIEFQFEPSQELAAKGINVTSVRESLHGVGEVLRGTPRVRTSGGILFDFVVATEKTDHDIDLLLPAGVTFKVVAERSEPKFTPAEVQPKAAPSSFVRVEMSKLDELMRLTGELVISRARLEENLRRIEKRLPGDDFQNLKDVNEAIERQLRGFREAVMRVRMIPIGQVFERMRFVIRGLERETNKRVRLEVLGQDTEIDKLIVDRMMDPLLHMVRNAVSHGLETPQERLAAAKSEEGTIHIQARTSGEKVVLELSDDGRGVELERVTARARSAGLLNPDESVEPQRILDILCSPGFSTRDSADLTSGRGVGMAVVQSTIRELGGSLVMDTKAGKGTRFTITLPLTLVILDAFLVTVRGQRFAVPQSGVREIVAVEESSVRHVEGNCLIPYRGDVLPVFHLVELFHMEPTFQDGLPQARGRFHVLVIEGEGTEIGLGVDRVSSQREIVVRSIADPSLKIPGVVGATELGDGRPVLIVDGEALLRQCCGARRQGA